MKRGGIPTRGIPGTSFDTLPEEFTCPDCAVRYKEDFEAVED